MIRNVLRTCTSRCTVKLVHAAIAWEDGILLLRFLFLIQCSGDYMNVAANCTHRAMDRTCTLFQNNTTSLPHSTLYSLKCCSIPVYVCVLHDMTGIDKNMNQSGWKIFPIWNVQELWWCDLLYWSKERKGWISKWNPNRAL